MSSSPERYGRPVLSPKHSNRNTPSPKRPKTANPFVDVRLEYSTVPLRNSPSPPRKQKSTRLPFEIFEDKKPYVRVGSGLSSVSNKSNHNDQENILQPKMRLEAGSGSGPGSDHNTVRSPLSDLSITKFPGYVLYPQTSKPARLTELYLSQTYNNDFKSLHKKLDFPCYLTPPRGQRSKYLVRSDSADDLDMKKAVHMKHRRSASVGKNESKKSLLRKNSFKILCN